MKNNAKYLIALGVMSILGTSNVAAKTDTKALHQELDIMTGILGTAFKQDRRSEGIRFQGVDVTYLAQQGVVFTVATSNSRGPFTFNFDFNRIFDGLTPPTAPSAPNVMRSHPWQGNMDEHDIQRMVEDAVELSEGLQRESREKYRELNERKREFSWEKRELERRLRDLEFEKRSSDSDGKKRIDSELKDINKELSELNTKATDLDKFAQKLQQEQKLADEKRQQALKQQYQSFLASFEARVGDVLCRYGAGVKAMDINENISFVLSGIGTIDQDGRQTKQDRVYVFSNKDVQDCVRDKINQEKLLKNATAYMF